MLLHRENIVKVSKKHDNRYDFAKRAITGFFLGVAFYFLFFLCPPFVFSITLGIITITILFIELPQIFKPNVISSWFIMPFYPILPFIFMILLNQSVQYRTLIFFMGALSLSFDFGSYSFGSLFGKHKIAPAISPRKTWEGALGGVIFAFTLINIIMWYQNAFVSIPMKLYITICLCTLSLCGDFFESYLKRIAKIKDSASFLPGHGGFLDRFDGLMFVLPVVYIFRNFFAQLFGL